MLKNIFYEEGLPVKIEIVSIRHYPIHMHNDIQLIYVLDGCVDLRLTFNTYHLRKNDFRYIHSEDIHALSSPNGKNKVLILSADVEYLEKLFPNIRTTIITMPTDKTLLLYHNQQLQLKYCIFSILDQFIRREEGFHHQIKDTLKTMFDVLYREFRGFTIDKENRTFVFKRLQDIRQTERLGEIIDDIYRNYVEPSTLEEIASKQNLNPYYLSHLFSQTIGINYRDFINMARVETSEYDLLASELSISHIALSSGFSNASYYNKHFTFWFDMSPKEYRTRYTGSTIARCLPDVIVHDIKDFADISSRVLEELSPFSDNFSTDPVSQIIHIDPNTSWESLRPQLELVFYNPDLLSEQSVDFDILQKLQNTLPGNCSFSIKVILEEPETDICGKNNENLTLHIQKILDDLMIKQSCRFNLGTTRSCKTICADNTDGSVKTPLYYLLQFITREHDDIHIDAHYISLKSGKSYHILCWNTHPFRTDDIVLKLSADLIGSPIFINTLSLKDYDGYLEKMKRLCQSGYDKNILPEATTKAIEQKIFSESRTLTVSEPFSLSLHIQCETLCFISILPLE